MYSSDYSSSSTSDCEYFDDFGHQVCFQNNYCAKSQKDSLVSDDDDFSKKFLKYFWKKQTKRDFNSLAVTSGQIFALDDLRLALKRDDVSAVEKFFKLGFNSESKLSEIDWTPLDYAVFYASNNSLRFIIAGCDNMNLSSQVVVGGGSIVKEESKILECLTILSEFGIKYSKEIVSKLDFESVEDCLFSETKIYSILTVTKWDAASIFLNAIQLSSLIPLFKNIPFHEFLLLEDNDLQKMGVDELSSRNEILYGIDSFHKCTWGDLSLGQDISKTLSGAELIAFFMIVKHQLKIIESTLCHVKRLVANNKCENWEMREIEDRCLQTKKNLKHLYDEVFEFRKTLDKISEGRLTLPPHLIEFKKRNSHMWSKWLFVCIPLLGTFLWYKVK